MVGEILDAKYRIDKQLGAGGMGNVYLATHLGTTRVVAVKVIAPKWATEPQFLARFQREAQACGRLRHPNIVNVTDFGVARAEGGAMPYLVMEFLDGQTLSTFQKENPELPLPLVADLLDQIGLALSEAHRHGIIHRDLKPDNIWLEPNGRGGYTAKVLDFGVAKVNLLGEWALPPQDTPPPMPGSPTPIPRDEMETAAIFVPAPVSLVQEMETAAMQPTPSGFSSGSFDSGASAQTMPGSLLGTPAYMSPEQALGKEIDFRSDIYSLSVVAYLLVWNELPFSRRSGDFIQYHESGIPAAPAGVRKVPGDVADAILAGLAKNPEDRPQSAVAFARRFHNAVDAEFLALRRSKAFLMQHLIAFGLLMIGIYGTLESITALLLAFGHNIVPVEIIRALAIPGFAAILFIFSDNLLRTAAALIAQDEQVRVRRFISFRVLWKMIRMTPRLIATQFQALFFVGPGWITGDCLWPVVQVVERRSGRDALLRSRELMTGLRSAGRALAIRHLALPTFAICTAIASLATVFRNGQIAHENVVLTGTWFPIFALYAGAPLFLYDRTAANESGPLLQLDRTPEVRTTARTFSVSSMIWIAAGILYLLYVPFKVWRDTR